MTIPEYVRGGFLVVGAMFTWRSANLFSLATVAHKVPTIGQANAEAVMAAVAMGYLVTALTWWVVSRLLPDRAWERLQFAEHEAQHELTPVMMTVDEVVHTAQDAGIATIGPNEGAEAVQRESPRSLKLVRRNG